MTFTLKWAKICPPWRGHYSPLWREALQKLDPPNPKML